MLRPGTSSGPGVSSGDEVRMAKSTNDSKSEGTNGEAKARRAPGRRSMDRKATDVHGLVASVADLARTKATTQAESHAVSARTATIELDALEKLSPEEVRRRAYELYVYLSLIHISEPTRLGMISYAVFC